MTPDNTYVGPNGRRQCRACIRIRGGWRKNREISDGGLYLRMGLCKKGLHKLEGDRTGGKGCRPCHLEAMRLWRERNR